MLVIRRSTQRSPERVQQDMDQLYRALMATRPRLYRDRQSNWRPALEVFETDSELIILAELAGIDESSLEINVEQQLLSIAGVRQPAVHAANRRYREAGISYGPFSAEVMLPFAVDLDCAEAELDAGMLRITMPRLKPRSIQPRAAAGK